MEAYPKQGPHYWELQTARLAEVQAMTPERWQALRQEMRQAQKLPKLNEHFRKHGEQFLELDIANPQEFEQLFLEHIQRADLGIYTYVTTQKGQQYRYWILIGMDNGVVALYNENKRRHWSFWRPNNFEGYLQGGRGWWVRVEESVGELKVQRW